MSGLEEKGRCISRQQRNKKTRNNTRIECNFVSIVLLCNKILTPAALKKLLHFVIRLRAVPLFSNSPSRAERKKQAARKLAARKLLPFAQTTAFARPTFARPVFFAPLSTDYKKTKGLLVVYFIIRHCPAL